jgi:hypothetical protein
VPPDLEDGVSIGGGTNIKRHLSATKEWDPGAIQPGGYATTNVYVPGARLGDTVAIGFSQNIGAGMTFSGIISAPDLATVIMVSHLHSFVNVPGAGVLRVDVWQH